MFILRCTRAPFAVGLAAILGWGAGLAHAADAVPFAQAEADVRLLGEQLKDPRRGNEDLLGSIAAIEAAFFRIEPGVLPDALGQVKASPGGSVQVKAWQERALDQLFRALTAVRYDARTKENRRNDVNLHAALALGNMLGSPDLAVHRDEKEVAKLRADRARGLMEAIENAFGKPKGGREYGTPAPVVDAAFAALASTNDPGALEWLRDEYLHTRGGDFEEVRLLAAHKALLRFTNVPARMRHALAKQLIISYRGAAASAAQNPPTGKAFWDRIKFGVVECFKYYAMAPGGGPPVNAAGDVLNTLEELHVWWRENDVLGKAPWVDPKAPK